MKFLVSVFWNSVLFVWLIFLIFPFLNIFLGIGTGEWNRNIDKGNFDLLFKGGLFLLTVFLYFLIVIFSENNKHNKKILKLNIFSFILLLFYILSSIYNDSESISEHYRLAVYIFLFFITSTAKLPFQINKLVYFTKFYTYSVIILFIIIISRGGFDSTDYVFFRLGHGFVDSNLLAATINLGFIYPIYILLNEPKLINRFKYYFLITLLIVMNIMTFSNGGLISLVLLFSSIFYYLSSNNSIKYFRKYAYFTISFILIFLIFNAQLIESVFPRISNLFDFNSKVGQESLGSRIIQYNNLFKVLTNGFSFVFGVSSGQITTYIGQEMHNSFLRPILAGGLFSFISFIFLNMISLNMYRKSIKSFKYLRQNLGTNVSILFFSCYIAWLFQAFTLPYESIPLFWFYFSISAILYRKSQLLLTN